MDALDISIREYKAADGNWLALEGYFQQAFTSKEPKQYYHAVFNLFEHYPEEDGAGVFWTALHYMEAIGGYEDLLLQYFRRTPTLMTRTMLRRILNSGQSHIGNVAIARLIEV